MIYGIGTDMVRISRLQNWLLNDGLLIRYFSPREIQYCKAQNGQSASALAARFAAKEAFGKALGIGLRGMRLSDIEVSKNELGAPVLALQGTALQALTTCGCLLSHLSLSHDGEYALATVIIEREGN